MKKIRSGQSQDTVLIGGIDAFVEPDSGENANVMDEYQFKALKHRSRENNNLEPRRDTLKTLQSDLTVKGEFNATLRNKNRGAQGKFLVIQVKMDSPPLLSKSTLLDLGMLKIDSEGTLKETNELRIKSAKKKLDLRQGYHQLALDPSTRKVATFSTPWGNYRPERLVFGARSLLKPKG